MDIEQHKSCDITEKQHTDITDDISDLICRFLPDCTLTYVNRAYCNYFNKSREDLIGTSFLDLVPDSEHSRILAHVDSFSAENAVYTYEYKSIGGDGSISWLRWTNRAFFDENCRLTQLQSVGTDITDIKKAMELIAYTDELTTLPNRRFFKKILDENIKYDEESFGLLFLDIKNFKFINDHLGIAVGDMFLESFAAKLLDTVPPGFMVSRTGVNEFAVIVPFEDEATKKNHMSSFVNVLKSALEHPLSVGEYTLFNDVSMGTALYPDDAKTSAELIQNAALALSLAKNELGTACIKYTRDLAVQSNRKFSLVNDLRMALKRQSGLQLHYQPQISIFSGEIMGFEALLRWNHPQLGYVPPSEFIPLAEENGIIIPLGEWIFSEACRQLRKWHDKGWKRPRVAVNFSVVQFFKRNLYESILETIQSTGVNPEWIEIEITETSVLKNEHVVLSRLGKLRSLGIRVSLDDFGTGYSSLNYVSRIDADIIKIDRSFIKGIPDDRTSMKMVNIISLIANEFDKTLVAEGVETKTQVEYLKLRGCEIVQGYYFSKPVEASAASEFLKEGFRFNV